MLCGYVHGLNFGNPRNLWVFEPKIFEPCSKIPVVTQNVLFLYVTEVS